MGKPSRQGRQAMPMREGKGRKGGKKKVKGGKRRHIAVRQGSIQRQVERQAGRHGYGHGRVRQVKVCG